MKDRFVCETACNQRMRESGSNSDKLEQEEEDRRSSQETGARRKVGGERQEAGEYCQETGQGGKREARGKMWDSICGFGRFLGQHFKAGGSGRREAGGRRQQAGHSSQSGRLFVMGDG